MSQPHLHIASDAYNCIETFVLKENPSSRQALSSEVFDLTN